jgi:PAS domain S-box-containing protein
MDPQAPDEQTRTDSLVFVDDDAFPREALRELLKTKGFEVHVAEDGLEGLEIIRRIHPDYIILDIILPKLDGSQVCWLLRRDRRLHSTPIIALSGLAPQDFRRFPRLSADAYVAKGPLPSVIPHLLAALQYVAERRGGVLHGGLFGYEGFRPRRLVSEMLAQMRRYAALIQLLSWGVLDLDAEGRILLANAAAAHLLGKREAQLIGQPFLALFPARSRQVLQDVLAEVQRAPTEETLRVTAALGPKALALGVSGAKDQGVVKRILVTITPAPAKSEAEAVRTNRSGPLL